MLDGCDPYKTIHLGGSGVAARSPSRSANLAFGGQRDRSRKSRIILSSPSDFSLESTHPQAESLFGSGPHSPEIDGINGCLRLAAAENDQICFGLQAPLRWQCTCLMNCWCNLHRREVVRGQSHHHFREAKVVNSEGNVGSTNIVQE